MGALNPLFLAAAVAVAVPVFLHLFHRHETRRFSFPALRYLERTEREHAREIRLRQLLLLVTRVAVLLLLVGAGARLVFSGRGAAHPATAVAIVLDNSMSSGLVVGETRVLDELKTLALQTLDGATDEDLFWVIRAGEPWLPAIPGSAAEARVAIEETEPSAAAGDLTSALARAGELLRTSELAEREIHLLSDLQRTAFDLPGEASTGGGTGADLGAPAGEVPVVVWVRPPPAAPNRALIRVLVGGGLPPLAGQRSELSVQALESAGDTTRWPIRVVVDGRIRGAGSLSAGSETTVALPPVGSGWVQGYVDTDPDPLRADDRRYFAYRSRTAPRVAVGGTPGLFVTEAVAALVGSGRAEAAPAASADVLLAQGGAGLEARGPQTAAVLIPASDPALLPALDLRLAEAGVAWRYEPRAGSGEAELTGAALPDALSGVRARLWFALTPNPQASDTRDARQIAGAAGAPWAVEARDAAGRRVLLLASPMVEEATTLPVSTGMVRFIDWIASEWGGAGGAVEYVAGDHLPAPSGATHVRFPSGRELEIDGTRTVRGTGEAGLYSFVAADSTLAVLALNPPAVESRLEPLDERDYAVAIGPGVTRVDQQDDWARAVFRTRTGPELWWPLILAALALLLAESVLASSGRAAARRSGPSEAAGAVL